jgi:hypothetical protein
MAASEKKATTVPLNWEEQAIIDEAFGRSNPPASL